MNEKVERGVVLTVLVQTILRTWTDSAGSPG